jgi:sugar phosphate isomerase/epimerase
VDSYSLKPLGLTPFKLLDWVRANGGDGVQFSEVNLPPGRAMDRRFLADLAQYAGEMKLYLEWGGAQHIPFDPESGRPVDTAKINRRAAEQAGILGVKPIRSCSGGLMRWKEDSPPTEYFLRAMSESLRQQRKMLEDFGVTLAIETHFEFTTFELRRLFLMAEAEPGGYLGICLDTMNLMTMLEDPVQAVKRILAWVVMTHVKDGGILLTDAGLTTFTAPAGEGIVDFAAIFGLLARLERTIQLSLEDHGGEFPIPIFDPDFLRKFPDLTTAELTRLISLAARTRRSVEQGRLAVVERSRWPEVCEARVKKGIGTIKGIVAQLES